MKFLPLLLALFFMLAGPVLAQSTNTAFKPAPPPPGINDPGVKAAAPAPAGSAKAAASTTTPAELTPTQMPGRPIPLPADPGASSDDTGQTTSATTTPDVSVTRQGDNTVRTYSRSGSVYMVVVTPKNGVQQTYMVGNDGRLTSSDGGPVVRPVMYNVLKWGKSKPAEDDGDDSAASATSSGQ